MAGGKNHRDTGEHGVARKNTSVTVCAVNASVVNKSGGKNIMRLRRFISHFCLIKFLFIGALTKLRQHFYLGASRTLDYFGSDRPL